MHTFRGLRKAAGALLAVVAFGALGESSALAQDPISEVLRARANEWSDGFDVTANTAPEVRTSIPILSQETVDSVGGAIAQYSEIVARGGWPIVPATEKLRIGVSSPAVAALRQRLIISGDLDYSRGVSDAFDSYVDEAVRRFQTRHGIPSDGVVGDSTFAALNVPATVRLNQLSTNLTRLKTLTQKLPDRFVMVNIPAASIEAVEAGRVAQRHTAVVGKVDRPSPILSSAVHEVNFNPFWTVPASIIRRDLIPIMQKDPEYLQRYRIRIYDQQGNELQTNQINWYSDEATNYMFRQDPGDFNSLGQVRINFHNKDGVYMHDTPAKGLFNEEYRFDSSGCVRVQNVRELITWLLRDTPGWDRQRVDAMYQTGERLDVQLAHRVPLYWSYITAWAVADGVVHFRSDIYGLDGLDQYAGQVGAQL